VENFLKRGGQDPVSWLRTGPPGQCCLASVRGEGKLSDQKGERRWEKRSAFRTGRGRNAVFLSGRRKLRPDKKNTTTPGRTVSS